ncbi:MAG: hypothetical protein AAGU11_11120 [Syntrophobacteraceae bacterium]
MMELNISELRKQKRPMWMTELDEECSSDILGGGGDIYTDRLSMDSAGYSGEEVLAEDLEALFAGKYVQEDYVS